MSSAPAVWITEAEVVDLLDLPEAIEALDLDVPLRNTMQESERRRELVEATGRGQVPVLRIESADGDVEWMPESEDIVRYLEERFGER